MREIEFIKLEDKILEAVIGKEGDEVLLLITADKEVFKMFHKQTCCESVYLAEVIGDIQDILYVPILLAAESSQSFDEKGTDASYTWTFYKLVTRKGTVTLRWYGASNGYYSEAVSVAQLN